MSLDILKKSGCYGRQKVHVVGYIIETVSGVNGEKLLLCQADRQMD
jgi:hypothetical protein